MKQIKRRLLCSILYDCGTKDSANECAIVSMYHDTKNDSFELWVNSGFLTLSSNHNGISINRFKEKIKDQTILIDMNKYYLHEILPNYKEGNVTHSDDIYISPYAKELLNI